MSWDIDSKDHSLILAYQRIYLHHTKNMTFWQKIKYLTKERIQEWK
jgi:hypothetical protein